MKVLKKTFVAGLIAACAVSLAEAQTVIHITGSTAYRGATHTAIRNILAPGHTFAYAGGTLSGAGRAIFTGNTITGNIPVIIKTSWSGSVGGQQTVSQNLPISTWLTNTTTQSTGGTSNAPSVFDPPTIPEVCMADGFQSSTPFPSPELTDQIVGVVPFKWVRNNGSPGTFTNITPQLAQALWLNGKLPLALFTGNSADTNTFVYAIGRDADSGTRLTAFAESGIGVFTDIIQYAPTNAAGNIISGSVPGPIAGQKPFPAQTINGIFYDVGRGGYAGGGDVAGALGASGSFAAFGGYYVSYLSTGDAATAIGLGAAEIGYNGFVFSNAAVQQGQYTFWGYEHLAYRSDYGTVDANGKTVADQLAGRIHDFDATLLVGSMKSTRQTDGGLVTNNY